MTVVDLFCGCGGISLGFQMAGCKVIYGLDNNLDAIETFKRNFPDAVTECRKIEDIDLSTIPQSDIIVGGPPCVNFSTAKGSRANVLEGIKLVQAFLRIVYIRKPKYWIMENVPRIGLHLPEKIPLRWIGIDEDGDLQVPVKMEFDISLFGAPQKRKRLLIGNYRIPEPSQKSAFELPLFKDYYKHAKTLGYILNAFPDPLSKPKGASITDPNYGIEISDINLSDHFMDTIIDEQEAKSIEIAKQQHPYMGKMDFPDDLTKLARTVVSLQMGRETLVIKTKDNKFRRATIRECSTLQTFPICFQFGGKSISSRYKQAGNAVPPILTYRLASLILEKENEKTTKKPAIFYPKLFEPAQERKKSVRKNINYNVGRVIRIPQKEVRGSRIELHSIGYPKVRWETELHVGEGKNNHYILSCSFEEAYKMAEQSIKRSDYSNTKKQLDELLIAIKKVKLNSSEAIHIFIHESKEYPLCIKNIEQLFETYFPKAKYSGINLKLVNPINGLKKDKLRIRILIALVLAKKIEKLINKVTESKTTK